MSHNTMKLVFTILCFTYISIANALDIPNLPEGLDEIKVSQGLAPDIPNLQDGLDGVKISPGLAPLDSSLALKLPKFPKIPKIPCLNTITNGAGCIDDLISSVMNVELHPFSESAKSCCEGVLKVEDKCWATLFPTNPLIPILVKAICTWVQSHPLSSSLSSPP